MTAHELGTSRVLLSPLDVVRDTADLVAVLKEPGTFAYVGQGPVSAGELPAFIASLTGRGITWTIRRRADNVAIGFCSLEILAPAGIWAEFGIVLAPSSHGAGLATEASDAVIEFAFAQAPLQGVLAGVKPGNAAARKLVERLGFVQIGNVPGPRSNELAYRLSRSDRGARVRYEPPS